LELQVISQLCTWMSHLDVTHSPHSSNPKGKRPPPFTDGPHVTDSQKWQRCPGAPGCFQSRYLALDVSLRQQGSRSRELEKVWQLTVPISIRIPAITGLGVNSSLCYSFSACQPHASLPVPHSHCWEPPSLHKMSHVWAYMLTECVSLQPPNRGIT
jgi:hypothetical protein